MIRDYRDHAANERTFLAWMRTGIGSFDAGRRLQLERLSGPVGRYDGLALILLGIALVVVSTTRFIRTRRLLDDQETHSIGGFRAELLFSTVLAVIVAGFSTYLAAS